MIVADEIQRQRCKQNIRTIKKITNLRVRVTPNFGRMVVYKERINERKKIIYFRRIVVIKWKIYVNENPNFWSNGLALKKK